MINLQIARQKIHELISRSDQIRPRMKPGDQIAYIPDHVLAQWEEFGNQLEDALVHTSVEFGFVTRDKRGQTVFCRYWMPFNHLGIRHPIQLRTKANSEATSFKNLIRIDTVTSQTVQKALKEYC